MINLLRHARYRSPARPRPTIHRRGLRYSNLGWRRRSETPICYPWKTIMIENEKIAQIATANLSVSSVSTATSESTVDSEGRDALKITIVLTPGSTAAIKSKASAVLDTLVQIKKKLQEEG